MNPTEHIKAAQRTKTGLKVDINDANEDLLHATMGISTEAGELLDVVKKHIFYGKPLDIHNIHEEIGDILWYVSILLEWSGATYEEVMETNIDKLRVRYPEKFSSDKALKRDLATEQAVLLGLCPRCFMYKTSCIC